MSPIRKQNELQMSVLPANTLRSTDTLPELAEAGMAHIAPQDSLGESRHWTPKQVMKLGLGVASAGLLVGATLAGVPTYLALAPAAHKTSVAKPTGMAPPTSSLAGLPPSPAIGQLPGGAAIPPATFQVTCQAPEGKINGTSSAVLMQQVNIDSPSFTLPLYGASGAPDSHDITGFGDGSYTVVGKFGLPGVVRASALQALAHYDPAFIESMLTPIGSQAYVVRLYDRNEADNTFSQVNVRVDVAELNDKIPSYDGVTMWWALILQAGAKLDNYIGFVPATILDGDRNDAAATRRQAIETIVGANVEIVSGDELDALRMAEVDVASSPSVDLYADAGNQDSEPNILVNDTRPITAGRLFEAKNDNWPSLLARMGDRRNLAMVNLHQPIDFKFEALTQSNGTENDSLFHTTSTLSTPSGASVTVDSGGPKFWSGETFLPITINVPGQQSVALYTGVNSAFAVVGFDAPDTLWLQSGPEVFGGYRVWETPFKMPADLLELAASQVTITRRPCQSDIVYQARGLTLA